MRACASIAILLSWVASSPVLAQSTEVTRLTASDPELWDKFGSAIAVSGDYAAVTDRIDGGVGAVYMFERVQGVWEEVEKLQPHDLFNNSTFPSFGYRLTLEGETLFVATPNGEISIGRTGVVYVFERTGQGWTQVQKLVASDAQVDAGFSIGLDFDGRTLMVAAPGQELPFPPVYYGFGQVYVFERVGQDWVEQEILISSDSGSMVAGAFGVDVSVEGDWAVMSNGTAHVSGTVYVFQRGPTGWVEVSTLQPASPQVDDHFGSVVDLSSKYLAVSEGPNGSAFFDRPDSIHFYERDPTDPAGWAWQGEYFGSNSFTNNEFGKAVSISGETVLVGAYNDNTAGTAAGAAFVFKRQGSGWFEAEKLVWSGADPHELAGLSVALDGSSAWVGAPVDLVGGISAGSVYVYEVPIDLATCPGENNSTGAPAVLRAVGSPELVRRDLRLEAWDLPPNEFGLFLASRAPAWIPSPGGSAGNLCLASPFARFQEQIVNSGSDGSFAIEVDLGAIPLSPPVPVAVGETWYFQAWYRDHDPAPTSNFTGAGAVTFF